MNLDEKILVRSNKSWFLLNRSEIQWLQARGENTLLHCGTKQLSVPVGMCSIEQDLDSDHFLRIHRSYIVNINVIREIKPRQQRGYDVILNDGTELPWSRHYVHRFQALQKFALKLSHNK